MHRLRESNHGPEDLPAEQQLLTKTQLARIVGVTSRTIDNWVRERKIPSISITRRCRRFIAADVIGALRRFETEVGA
jgi:excisionase family DNA binding protein